MLLGIPMGQLAIKEVIAPGDLENERVIVELVGNVDVAMLGWALQDAEGNTFSFPALTMHSGGAVAVYSKPGTISAVNLYWGLEEAIWQVGEQVKLYDPEGNLQATYTIP